MSQTAILAEPAKQEITITHEFDAPPELVFRCYTEPELVARWWGPRYLTNDVQQHEARDGGSWRIVQRTPDGTEHGFHGVFHLVSAPQRLVRTSEYEGAAGHVALETVEFENVQGRTRVVTHAVFQSLADRDAMVSAGMESGVREGFERLAELLEELA
jgi:uncharacterized protein YndB with AHSA1/START domain